MTAARKLSRREIAQLGGLAVAARTDMAELGRRGGLRNLEKNGRVALIRANHIRHGKLPRKAAKE